MAVLISKFSQNDELEIQSATLENGDVLSAPSLSDNQIRLSLNSRVHCVFDSYRTVICLDMSPSLHSLDHVTGLLLFDHLFRSAAAALVSLIQPLRLPHSPFLSQPQVHVSIIALDSTELTNEEPSENPRSPKLHVLLPSVVVSSSNVPQVLQDLRNSLLHLENLQVGHTHMKSVSKSSSEYSDRAGDIKLLLQSGLFTLSLMNLSAHPQLILVTPGDLQLTSSESGVLDSVLSQCARSDVRVTILHTMSPNGRVNTSSSSIIKLDGFDETLSTLIARQNATLGESQIRSFGDVADTDLLQFVATSTNGVLLDRTATIDACFGSMQFPGIQSQSSSTFPSFPSTAQSQKILSEFLTNRLAWHRLFSSRDSSHFIEVLSQTSATPELQSFQAFPSFSSPFQLKVLCIRSLLNPTGIARYAALDPIASMLGSAYDAFLLARTERRANGVGIGSETPNTPSSEIGKFRPPISPLSRGYRAKSSEFDDFSLADEPVVGMRRRTSYGSFNQLNTLDETLVINEITHLQPRDILNLAFVSSFFNPNYNLPDAASRSAFLVAVLLSNHAKLPSLLRLGLDSRLGDFNTRISLATSKLIVKEYPLMVDVGRLVETRVNGGFHDVQVALGSLKSRQSDSSLAIVITMKSQFKSSITVEYKIRVPVSSVPGRSFPVPMSADRLTPSVRSQPASASIVEATQKSTSLLSSINDFSSLLPMNSPIKRSESLLNMSAPTQESVASSPNTSYTNPDSAAISPNSSSQLLAELGSYKGAKPPSPLLSDKDSFPERFSLVPISVVRDSKLTIDRNNLSKNQTGPINRESRVQVEIRIIASNELLGRYGAANATSSKSRSSSSLKSLSTAAENNLKIAVHRLQTFIGALTDSDKILSHLSLVRNATINPTSADSAKPNSSQMSSSASLPGFVNTAAQHNQSSLWQVLSTMSINSWRRSLFVSTFNLIFLNHKAPGLDNSSANDSIDYRTAVRVLFAALSAWSTLASSAHFFVKLIQSLDKQSFGTCLVRVAWETKTLASIQVAFSGISSSMRTKIISQIRSFISRSFAVLTINGVKTKVYPFVISRHRGISALLLRPDVSTTPEPSSRSGVDSSASKLSNRRNTSFRSSSSKLTELSTSSSKSSIATLTPHVIAPVPDTQARPPLNSFLQSIMRRFQWRFAFVDQRQCASFMDEVAQIRRNQGFVPVLSDASRHLFLREIPLSGSSEDAENIRSALMQFCVTMERASDGCFIANFELCVEALSGHLIVSDSNIPSADLFLHISREMMSRDWILFMAFTSTDALRPTFFVAPPSPSQPLSILLSHSKHQQSVWQQQFEFWKLHHVIEVEDQSYLKIQQLLQTHKYQCIRFQDASSYAATFRDPISPFCQSKCDDFKKLNSFSGFSESNHSRTLSLPFKTGSVSVSFHSDFSAPNDTGATIGLPFDISSVLDVTTPAVAELILLNPVQFDHSDVDVAPIQWTLQSESKFILQHVLSLSPVSSPNSLFVAPLAELRICAAMCLHEMLIWSFKKIADVEIVPGQVYARGLPDGGFVVWVLPMHPVWSLMSSLSEQDRSALIAKFSLSENCTSAEIRGRNLIYSRALKFLAENHSQSVLLESRNETNNFTNYFVFNVSRANMSALINSSVDCNLASKYWNDRNPKLLNDGTNNFEFSNFVALPSILSMERKIAPRIPLISAVSPSEISASEVFSADILKNHERHLTTTMYLNMLMQVPVAVDDFKKALQDCQKFALDIDGSMLSKLDPAAFESQSSVMELLSAIILTHFRPIPGTEYYYYHPPAFSTASAVTSHEAEVDLTKTEEVERTIGVSAHKLTGTPASDHSTINEEDDFGPRWSILTQSEYFESSVLDHDGNRHELAAGDRPHFLDRFGSILKASDSVPGTCSWSPSDSLNPSALPRPLFLRLEKLQEIQDLNGDSLLIDQISCWSAVNLRDRLRPSKHTTSLRLLLFTTVNEDNSAVDAVSFFDRQHVDLPEAPASPKKKSIREFKPFSELPSDSQHALRDFCRQLQTLIADHSLSQMLNFSPCLNSFEIVLKPESDFELKALQAALRRNQMHLLYAVRSYYTLLSKLQSSSLSVELISLPLLPSAESRSKLIDELSHSLFLPLKKFVLPDIQLFWISSATSGSPSPANSAPLNFWAVLSIQSDHYATLCLHSTALSSDEKKGFVDRIRNGLQLACHRVSQLMLLSSLNETRVCSGLLLAPSADDDAASQDPILAAGNFSVRSNVTSSNNTQTMNDPFSHLFRSKSYKHSGPLGHDDFMFRAGQFSCPRVYKAVIPLHPRLPAVRALRSLTGSSLHQFVVNNRHNLFVFQEKSGKIFYIRLSHRAQTSSSSRSVSTHSTPLPSPSPSRSTSPTRSGSNDPANPINSSVPLVVNQTDELILEVFGVDTPSEEVTVQLFNLLRSKITNMIVGIVSTLLQRNPLFKLLPSDIDVLRPPRTKPAVSAAVKLPNSVTDLYLYILLLKSNLHQMSLTSVQITGAAGEEEGVESASTRPRHSSITNAQPPIPSLVPIESSHHAFTESSASLRPNELSFVYNYNPPAGSVFMGSSEQQQSKIGKGMAMVSGAIFDMSTHKCVSQVPSTLFKKFLDSSAAPVCEEQHSICSESFARLQKFDLEPRVDGAISSLLSHVQSNMLTVVEESSTAGSNDETTFKLKDAENSLTDLFSSSDTSQSRFLLFDIWPQSGIDSVSLLEAIHNACQATLYEYNIEMHFLSRPCPISAFGPRILAPTLDVAQSAVAIGCASFSRTDINVQLTRWSLQSLARQVSETLSSADTGSNKSAKSGALAPVILASKTSKPGSFVPLQQLEREDAQTVSTRNTRRSDSGDSLGSNTYTVSAGFQLVSDDQGPLPCSSLSYVAIHSHVTTGNDPWLSDAIISVSGATSAQYLASAMSVASNAPDRTKDFVLVQRSSLLLICVESQCLSIVSYNVHSNLITALHQQIMKLTQWTNSRVRLLDNLLYQKLGLPHHAAQSIEGFPHRTTLPPILSPSSAAVIELPDLVIRQGSTYRYYLTSNNDQQSVASENASELDFDKMFDLVQNKKPSTLPQIHFQMPSSVGSAQLTSPTSVSASQMKTSISGRSGPSAPAQSYLAARKMQQQSIFSSARGGNVPKSDKPNTPQPDSKDSVATVVDKSALPTNILFLLSMFLDGSSPEAISILWANTPRQLQESLKASMNRLIVNAFRFSHVLSASDTVKRYSSPSPLAVSPAIFDPVQSHGMSLFRALAQAALSLLRHPHLSWPLPTNGDLRKVASRTAQLPALASASRSIAVIRAPLVFSDARQMLLHEPGAYRSDTTQSGKSATPKFSILQSNWQRVVDPDDQSTILSSATSPFLSFVTKQTNKYYRLLEAFLQDYCNYLEKELDARVVVVLDGSEQASEIQSNRAALASGLVSAASMATAKMLGARAYGKPNIVIEDALVVLKPIRLYLQRPAHSHQMLLEIRFQHMHIGATLQLANLPSILAPAHGTHFSGRRGPIGTALNRRGSVLKDVDSVEDSHLHSTRPGEFSAGMQLELVKLRNSLHLTSFSYDFHLRHLVNILDSNVSSNSMDYPSLNPIESLATLIKLHPKAPAHARNFAVSDVVQLELAHPAIHNRDFFRYLARNAGQYNLKNLDALRARDESARGELTDSKDDDPVLVVFSDWEYIGGQVPTPFEWNSATTETDANNSSRRRFKYALVLRAAAATPAPIVLESSPPEVTSVPSTPLHARPRSVAVESTPRSVRPPPGTPMPPHLSRALISPPRPQKESSHSSLSAVRKYLNTGAIGGGDGTLDLTRTDLYASPHADEHSSTQSSILDSQLQVSNLLLPNASQSAKRRSKTIANATKAAQGALAHATSGTPEQPKHEWSLLALNVEFLLVRIDIDSVAPYAEPHDGNSAENSSSEWNYLDQVQQQQVIPATRDLIRRTIRQALVQYQRDALWQTILESDNSKDVNISADDYEAFENLTFRRPFECIDVALRPLLRMSHLWKSMFAYLQKAYGPSRTRTFATSLDRHLLVFSDADSDLMIHIIVHNIERDAEIEFVACRRELRVVLQSPGEQQLITHLVNTVCHFLWRNLL